MSIAAILFYFVLGLIGVLYLRRKRSRGSNYPPGPWGLPILGHLPLMGDSPHKKCTQWGKIYGPVLAVDFGAFPSVVISDVKLIREAFNDQAFSGRPRLSTFVGRSGGIPEGVFFTEGTKWMEQRSFIIRTLRDFGFGKNSMEVIVQEEIKDLIQSFKKVVGTPQSTQNCFNAAFMNALWILVAGERFKQDDPELLVAIKHVTASIQDKNTRASLGQFLPFIAKIAPKVSGLEKLIEDIFPIIQFVRKQIEQHKATLQHGEPRDFIDVYLEEIHKTTDPQSSFYKENGKRSILFTVLDLFLAGAETTSTTLQWTFLYMAKYPEAQKKLQAEILEVVGDSRLPSLSDRPKMPYTEATIHEIMRFSSLVPLNVIHSTMREVKLGGYTIPKDTMIMANNYSVHNDEKIWGDPQNFRPERFLNKDGVFTKSEAFLAFSVGRRACIGETLARDELFLFTTSLLQVFTISPVGSVKDLAIEPKLGVVLSPKTREFILRERN